jgi:hypothetical protein
MGRKSCICATTEAMLQSRTGISTSHAPTFGPLLQSSELRDRTFPIPNCFEPGGRSAKNAYGFFNREQMGRKSPHVWSDYRSEDRMWEIFAGIALWAILYPMTQEWLQRRTDKKRLADMRKHFSMRHQWDALKGRWIDE